MSNLLCRLAEGVFWTARQIERADNLARILDVTESFSPVTVGAEQWRAVLLLYAQEPAFVARYGKPTRDDVVAFTVLDHDNPNSIVANIRMARENARALRPLISTEMWLQLNMFHGKLKELRRKDLKNEGLGRLCNFVKESCQTHFGITAETFYRDEAWNLYRLGQNLERADQTTRLLDVKYHLLLPSLADVGSPVDVSQWNALLRSAAGFHAYRRIHPSALSPSRVAEFLLFNDRFPRSVAACINAADAQLGDLRARFGVAAGAEAEAHLRAFRTRFAGDRIDAVIAHGLHEYLDAIQREIITVTALLQAAYFGRDTVAAAAAA